MKVLLTGNVGYVSETMLESAFAKCQVTILGETELKSSTDRKLIVRPFPQSKWEMQQNFESQDYEYIIYFSDSLTLGGDQTSEIEQLDKLMKICAEENRGARVVYLSGPQTFQTANGSEAIFAQAVEELFRHYSDNRELRVKLIRMPYICSAVLKTDPFYDIFHQVKHDEDIFLKGDPEQNITFLTMNDLTSLLFRLRDFWEDDETNFEILQVSDPFGITVEQLADAIERLKDEGNEPAQSKKYRVYVSQNSEGITPTASFHETEERMVFPEDDHRLRNKYHWFPKISLLEELPELYEQYCIYEAREKKGRSLKRWIRDRKIHKKFVPVIELVGAFFVLEFLNMLMGNVVQFQMIDIRLLYVVLMGTIHGMYVGLASGIFASFSLVLAYMRNGVDFLTLFYETPNWIPFIAYLVTGTVCGYVRMRDREDVAFMTQEVEAIKGKYYFISRLYGDTLHDKKEYKKQIMGSQDSFGKIYDVTRQLDVVHPQEMFLKVTQVLEKLLSNKTIILYSIGSGNKNFARLEVASRNVLDGAQKSIKLEDYRIAMEALEKDTVWVNKGLDPEYPMYIAAIRRQSGEIAMLVFLEKADASQMSLYYMNLLKILAGLIEASLIRAINYREAIREKQFIEGTKIMNMENFIETLKLRQNMKDENISMYMILRLDTKGRTLQEADEILRRCVRENDMLGMDGNGTIYLILSQATDETLPFVVKRLENVGIECSRVSKEEEEKMTQ